MDEQEGDNSYHTARYRVLLPPTDHVTTPADVPLSPVRRNDGPRVAKTSDLEETWPDVNAWLLSRLTRRLDRATAEDVCQEVAVRVLRAMNKGRIFASVGELARWSETVALHRVIDLWRSAQRGPALLPAGAIDVGTLVESRLALSEVAAALAVLPDSQREAVLDDEPLGRDDPASLRRRTARFRARARLRGMVHNWPVIGTAAFARWLRRQHRWGSRIHPEAAVSWAQVAAGVCLSFMVAGAGSHAHELADRRPQPAAATSVSTPLVDPSVLVSGDPSRAAEPHRPPETSPVTPRSGHPPTPRLEPLARVANPAGGNTEVGFMEPEGEFSCLSVKEGEWICAPKAPTLVPPPVALPAP